MKARWQLYILITILLSIGIGLTFYKYSVLGFTLTPGDTETVWQVQARIQFEAEDGPVKVSMALPSEEKSRRRVFFENISKDYRYAVSGEGESRRAVWTRGNAQGIQVVFLRGDFYIQEGSKTKEPAHKPVPSVDLEEPTRLAAEAVLLKARELADSRQDLVIKVLGLMKEDSSDANVHVLLKDIQYRRENLEQVAKILALDGIHARVPRGLRLNADYTQRSITSFIKVYITVKWVLLDPKALEEIPLDEVILWPEGTRGLLDVFGDHDSRIDLSVSSSQVSAGRMAVAAGKHSQSALVDFSIYSLPIRDQNAFKLLLLIPFGALVVVILRNLVGIRTSGTFMPILIALVFMQTTLLVGLILFFIIVGIGLVMRSYLSHLNLLLVPRIASVLVFVIIIFAAIGITSHKLGWQSGLTVMFFPMIILSWTIERMSILWEEEGPREVFIQGGGSLLTASLAYMVMINPTIAHLTFNFPELLLVLLAIIIMIGSYSGFRLLELARFEPMTREIE